ncbi:amidase [Sciscionella sediminilitoris]|uniref:amidase n=1 Tax=Sciscionella sediminilitoris TaxID=1445613 RepID=UPI0004DF53FF|nr:amidase [Sciscionella sp. SE31]
MAVTPPERADITRLAHQYGFGVNSAEIDSYRDLVTAALASYDEVDGLYRRYRETMPERAFTIPDAAENEYAAWYVRTRISGTGQGPLAGRTVVLKDNIALAGVPMMNGSRAVEGFRPLRDATVVRRLLDAGAVIGGKAVCEDLCFSAGSFTAASGPVRNPWDPARMTGGSSAGCAALLAAGEAELAVGGDQGGSIRLPAAFCGVVGHKPTHGLVPYTGAFPIETTLDHLGPMTRTVADAALLLGVLAGDDGYDPRQYRTSTPQDYLAALGGDLSGLRIGVLEEGFGWPGLSLAPVDEAVLEATRVLAAAGARVSRIGVPWHRDGLHLWNVIATEGATTQMIDGNAFGMNWAGRYDPELLEHYAHGRVATAEQMAVTLKATALCGRYTIERHGGRYYAMARELAWRLRAAYDEALTEVDLLALPTVPYTARPIPDSGYTEAGLIEAALGMLHNTVPFDVTGHPAISVPAGLVDGLPTGLMLVGRRFADADCLRAAAAYESALDGFPSPNV